MYLNEIKRLAEIEISKTEYQTALEFTKLNKIAVFIVAYNAEKYLESVISRIPADFGKIFAEIFIIDDFSNDQTFEIGKQIITKYPEYNLNVYRTPYNRGYGGNQKLGYLYCIKKKYDYVILLHGDGQYAPEYIPKIISAFADKEKNTDVVFASRMINKKQALAGGMPLYKWLGNQLLTYFENKMLGLNLSEFHTGFRAYKISKLLEAPFEFNSDNFHFDTEIIIQAKALNWQITEISLPTYYGDEECRVNGIKYAINCIKSVFRYRLVNLGLYYKRNYDFGIFESERYHFKKSKYSLHQYILKKIILKTTDISAEFGANQGLLSAVIAEKVSKHYAIDIQKPVFAGKSEAIEINLNQDFTNIFNHQKIDVCIALDIIEHLENPENFIKQIFQIMKTDGLIYISTANIAYLPMRLSLLLGQFNYGKRGILDMTHKRLFTIKSLKKLLETYGFKILEIKAFAPPLTDLISNTKIMRVLEKIHYQLANFWRGLFAYNFLIIAKRTDSLEEIFSKTINKKE